MTIPRWFCKIACAMTFGYVRFFRFEGVRGQYIQIGARAYALDEAAKEETRRMWKERCK